MCRIISGSTPGGAIPGEEPGFGRIHCGVQFCENWECRPVFPGEPLLLELIPEWLHTCDKVPSRQEQREGRGRAFHSELCLHLSQEPVVFITVDADIDENRILFGGLFLPERLEQIAVAAGIRPEENQIRGL